MPDANPTILLAFSSSRIGGAERSLTRMADYAITHLHADIRFASMGAEGEWSDWLSRLGHTVLPIRHSNWTAVKAWRLLQYATSNAVDVIYVIGLRLSLYMRLLRPFFFMTSTLVHGIRWAPSSTHRLDRVTRIIERTLGFLVDGYIVNSRAAQEVLVRRCAVPAPKVATIYNGIVLPEPAAASPPAEKMVLTVANFSPRKGYIEYLEAVALVMKEHPRVKFMFAGHDYMRGAVQSAILAKGLQNAVSVVGFVPDITGLLAQARLFVLPSLYSEGCPTAIIEAMAQAIPVVAYDMCGNNELVIHRETGLLCPSGDSTMLARTISELLHDDGRCEELGKNGRHRAQALFSLSASAKQHVRVLEQWRKTP